LTTKDFLLNVLSDAEILIPGYTIYNGKYTKQAQKKQSLDDLLENNIVNLNTFINWKNNGYICLNKNYLPKLENIIAKYGIDYPYLFFRGIYKGKIINKVNDKETQSFLADTYKLSPTQAGFLNDLLDDYVESTDEPSLASFHDWYLVAQKRYTKLFNQIEELKEEEKLYEAFNRYYDFASPVREDKKCLDYYPLIFKRSEIN